MSYKDPIKQKKYQRLWRRKRAIQDRIRAYKLLGGECINCGITDGRVLTIDHIEPELRPNNHGYSSTRLKAKIVNGSEAFVPKLRADSIDDVKNALQALLGNTGDKRIPIRQGEKFHETLINVDELRHTYETDSKYVIINEELSESEFKDKYPNFKKTSLKDRYSSDTVEKIPRDELIEILSKSDLL